MKQESDPEQEGAAEASERNMGPAPTGTPETPFAAATSSSQSEPPSADDLTRIRGIGPDEAKLLNKHGIMSFAQLAEANEEQLQEILETAEVRYDEKMPTQWGQQAALAALGKWEELAALQSKFEG